jgi:hypothetical protein
MLGGNGLDGDAAGGAAANSGHPADPSLATIGLLSAYPTDGMSSRRAR